MSGSGKGLLGLWLYRSGEQEWAVKEGSPLHNQDDLVVNKLLYYRLKRDTVVSVRKKNHFNFNHFNEKKKIR